MNVTSLPQLSFEVLADQPERAMRFYSGLLGWSFSQSSGPRDSWLISLPGAEETRAFGTLVKREAIFIGNARNQSIVNAFVCVVRVESLNDAVSRAAALGGSVSSLVMELPGVGRRTNILDTEGNVLGLLEPVLKH